MSKKALLFLNGEVPTILPDTANYDMIFCTDGAGHGSSPEGLCAAARQLNTSPEPLSRPIRGTVRNPVP